MFNTEEQLVNELKLNFSSMCDWDTKKFTTCIFEEVNMGFGIADLVISKVLKGKIDTSYLNYFDILIYKIIEDDQETSLQKIKEITKANDSQIKKSLEKLMFDSYINKQDTFFYINKSYKTIASKSIAIEAKLKNWKRALSQAFRYKWFASQSYVILDSKHINPAIVNIEEFVKLNVGLAELNVNGKLTIHFRSKVEKPIDDRMFILYNEHIKKILLGQQIGFPSS